MTEMPANKASHIGDTKGGSSNSFGGAAARLQGNPAGVHVKIHDTFGNAVASKVHVEIWGCSAKDLKPNTRQVTLFIPQDKWDSGAYVPAGQPSGTCAVKVHAIAADVSKMSYGPPGNPVAPGEVVQNVTLIPGGLAECEIVLDPVSNGTVQKILVTLPSTRGVGGTARYSDKTWSMDAGASATLGQTRQAGAPSVIRGCSKIKLEAVTEPEGVPAKWQVVPWDSGTTATPPTCDAFGRYSSMDTSVAGAWAIGASTDGGSTWTYFAIEVIDVSLAGSPTTGGTGDFVFEKAKDNSTMGFTSGDFFDKNPGAASKGFYCKVPVKITSAVDKSLGGVYLAAIQNVATQADLAVHATYDGGGTQAKKFSKTPALDGPSDNSTPEWSADYDMVRVTPTQDDVQKSAPSSPLTVQFEFCDSPGPYFRRKLGGKDLTGETGGINFRVALVARTDSAPSSWVAIAEAKWSVDLSGKITLNIFTADMGVPSGSRGASSGFQAVGPTDVGTNGGLGYEINAPSVLGGGWSWDPDS